MFIWTHIHSNWDRSKPCLTTKQRNEMKSWMQPQVAGCLCVFKQSQLFSGPFFPNWPLFCYLFYGCESAQWYRHPAVVCSSGGLFGPVCSTVSWLLTKVLILGVSGVVHGSNHHTLIKSVVSNVDVIVETFFFFFCAAFPSFIQLCAVFRPCCLISSSYHISITRNLCIR